MLYCVSSRLFCICISQPSYLKRLFTHGASSGHAIRASKSLGNTYGIIWSKGNGDGTDGYVEDLLFDSTNHSFVSYRQLNDNHGSKNDFTSLMFLLYSQVETIGGLELGILTGIMVQSMYIIAVLSLTSILNGHLRS